MPATVDPYVARDGIFVPPTPIVHAEQDYDERGYRILSDMQRRHFWHRGRHRFLAHAVRRFAPPAAAGQQRVIDLGGGCGGWVEYMQRSLLFPGAELALGDSSPVALRAARELLGPGVGCYQIDLGRLGWSSRWNVVFLLDVIEHLDDDLGALRSVHEALAPGGRLFVTVPAL